MTKKLMMCVPYWLAIGVHESVNNTAPPSMSLLVWVVPMGADRNRSAILRGRGEGRRGEGRGGEGRGGEEGRRREVATN